MNQKNPAVTPLGLASVGCFIGIIGIPCLLFAPFFLWSAFSSSQWDRTTGTVESVRASLNDSNPVNTASGQIGGGTRFTPIEERPHAAVVRYSYSVNGESLSGDRYSLGGGSTALEANNRAEALAKGKEAYPPGSEITVYYDPERPSSAVLAPGLNWGSFVPLILGLLFGPPSLWLFYRAWAMHRGLG